jgi:cytochrome c-type biogenesis protein
LIFLSFGVGMAIPLLVLSCASDLMGKRILFLLTRHNRLISVGAGIIMLAISLYYLIFVFGIEMLRF